VLAVASDDVAETKASVNTWRAEAQDAQRRERLAAKTDARKRSKKAAKARKKKRK
jgi:hypothetical protein